MNVTEREQAEVVNLKVLPLFQERRQEDILQDDPLERLLEEASLSDELEAVPEMRVGRVVREDQFPDQSLYILDEQLKALKKSLSRMRFYVGEIDDILPHKK